MSEIPERKVLKEMLVKLKRKTIISKRRHRQLETQTNRILPLLANKLGEIAGKRMSMSTRTQSILGMVSEFLHYFDALVSSSDGLVENLEIYMETLERYSAELDKTLTGIFEQAKKLAEEQQKKQEELRKRKAPESYRV